MAAFYQPIVVYVTAGTQWLYRADTGATSGDPGAGDILWNNANQAAATRLYFSHLTSDGIDIDLLLEQIALTNVLIVQDRYNSDNYQRWTVSGVITIHANSYVEVPVTLAASGGTGTTGFANNHPLVVYWLR